MHILIIRKLRTRLILFFAISFFWLAAILIFNMLMKGSLVHNITINNEISFSYPFSFVLEDVFVNESLDLSAIQANSTSGIIYTRKFSSYSSISGNFSFIYPSIFTLSQKEFAGSDILYHIDITDNSSGIHGFVQVWNMPYNLGTFLQNSKDTSRLNYKYFNSKPTTVNNLSGYIWDYAFITSEGAEIKGSEAFLKKDDKMYRISYFVPEKKWNKTQAEIFMKMLKSFKVY